MIAAIIPTLFHPPTLAPLLDVLRADDVDVILIDTTGRELDIYRWWNEGVAEARARGATKIAVLNDDIAMAPGTLPLLAFLLDEHPEYGVVSPATTGKAKNGVGKLISTRGLWKGASHPGMAGYAFMFRADLDIPFDERYRWYAGDDQFEEDVRAAGLLVGVYTGLQVQHLDNYSGAQRADELKPLANADRRRWKERNDPVRDDLEKAYLSYRSPKGKMTAPSIPPVIHRIAIGTPPADARRFWAQFEALHPDWTLISHDSPFDPKDWPLTSWTWPFIEYPAQQADYMRLEVLWREGGIYVDWDMEPYRPLDPFLPLKGFAAYDSPSAKTRPEWIGTGVLGFRPHHPAVKEMLDIALERFVEKPDDIMWAGPLAATAALEGRNDVLLLPFGSFYSGEWSERQSMDDLQYFGDGWAYAHHRMHASWSGIQQPPRRARSPRWTPKETQL